MSEGCANTLQRLWKITRDTQGLNTISLIYLVPYIPADLDIPAENLSRDPCCISENMGVTRFSTPPIPACSAGWDLPGRNLGNSHAKTLRPSPFALRNNRSRPTLTPPGKRVTFWVTVQCLKERC